jgi:hypothetical protein
MVKPPVLFKARVPSHQIHPMNGQPTIYMRGLAGGLVTERRYSADNMANENVEAKSLA